MWNWEMVGKGWRDASTSLKSGWGLWVEGGASVVGGVCVDDIVVKFVGMWCEVYDEDTKGEAVFMQGMGIMGCGKASFDTTAADEFPEWSHGGKFSRSCNSIGI